MCAQCDRWTGGGKADERGGTVVAVDCFGADRHRDLKADASISSSDSIDDSALSLDWRAQLLSRLIGISTWAATTPGPPLPPWGMAAHEGKDTQKQQATREEMSDTYRLECEAYLTGLAGLDMLGGEGGSSLYEASINSVGKYATSLAATTPPTTAAHPKTKGFIPHGRDTTPLRRGDTTECAVNASRAASCDSAALTAAVAEGGQTLSRALESILPSVSLEVFLLRAEEKETVAAAAAGQRLLALRHSSRCSGGGVLTRGAGCSSFRRCGDMRMLWRHMLQCSKRRCSYRLCTLATWEIQHFKTCRLRGCALCSPVRLDMREGWNTESSSPRPSTPCTRAAVSGAAENARIANGYDEADPLTSRLVGMRLLEAGAAETPPPGRRQYSRSCCSRRHSIEINHFDVDYSRHSTGTKKGNGGGGHRKSYESSDICTGIKGCRDYHEGKSPNTVSTEPLSENEPATPGTKGQCLHSALLPDHQRRGASPSKLSHHLNDGKQTWKMVSRKKLPRVGVFTLSKAARHKWVNAESDDAARNQGGRDVSDGSKETHSQRKDALRRFLHFGRRRLRALGARKHERDSERDGDGGSGVWSGLARATEDQTSLLARGHDDVIETKDSQNHKEEFATQQGTGSTVVSCPTTLKESCFAVDADERVSSSTNLLFGTKDNVSADNMRRTFRRKVRAKQWQQVCKNSIRLHESHGNRFRPLLSQRGRWCAQATPSSMPSPSFSALGTPAPSEHRHESDVWTNEKQRRPMSMTQPNRWARKVMRGLKSRVSPVSTLVSFGRRFGGGDRRNRERSQTYEDEEMTYLVWPKRGRRNDCLDTEKDVQRQESISSSSWNSFCFSRRGDLNCSSRRQGSSDADRRLHHDDEVQQPLVSADSGGNTHVDDTTWRAPFCGSAASHGGYHKHSRKEGNTSSIYRSEPEGIRKTSAFRSIALARTYLKGHRAKITGATAMSTRFVQPNSPCGGSTAFSWSSSDDCHDSNQYQIATSFSRRGSPIKSAVLHQQQCLLLLLQHVESCPVAPYTSTEKNDVVAEEEQHKDYRDGHGAFCGISPHCSAVQRLWSHVALCVNAKCPDWLCRNASILLRHFYHCELKDACNLCRPVYLSRRS